MDYNKLIDHTNLKQDAQEADIIKLCDGNPFLGFNTPLFRI